MIILNKFKGNHKKKKNLYGKKGLRSRASDWLQAVEVRAPSRNSVAADKRGRGGQRVAGNRCKLNFRGLGGGNEVPGKARSGEQCGSGDSRGGEDRGHGRGQGCQGMTRTGEVWASLKERGAPQLSKIRRTLRADQEPQLQLRDLRVRGEATGREGKSGEGASPCHPRPLQCHWAAAAAPAPPFLHRTPPARWPGPCALRVRAPPSWSPRWSGPGR